jgi:hypothetical protein
MGPAPPKPAPASNPFVKMARGSVCADVRNRLYLIDEKLVVWDRAGNCPDNSYSLTLYGKSLDEILCVYHDSIAGPRKNCRDPAYAEMFEILLAHMNDADLGLGPEHAVRRMPL